jgi:hypothetical protein
MLGETMKVLHDRQSCMKLIEDQLKIEYIENSIITTISKQAVELFKSDEITEVSTDIGFNILSKCYAIKNDDLKLLKAFRNGELTLASSNFIFHELTISSIAGLLFIILEIGCNIKKKGVILTSMQFTILTTLKNNVKRMTINELHMMIIGQDAKNDSNLTIERLKKELDHLTAISTHNGNIIALVSKDGNKRIGIIDL